MCNAPQNPSSLNLISSLIYELNFQPRLTSTCVEGTTSHLGNQLVSRVEKKQNKVATVQNWHLDAICNPTHHPHNTLYYMAIYIYANHQKINSRENKSGNHFTLHFRVDNNKNSEANNQDWIDTLPTLFGEAIIIISKSKEEKILRSALSCKYPFLRPNSFGVHRSYVARLSYYCCYPQNYLIAEGVKQLKLTFV